MPPAVRHRWSEEAFAARRLAAAAAPHQPLAIVAAAVVVGIAADRYLGLGAFAVLPACLAACGWLVVLPRRMLGTASLALLAAVCLTASAWHHLQWRVFAADDLGRFATTNATPVCLDAVVTGAPIRRQAPAPSPMRAIPQGEKTVVALRVTRLRNGADWRHASGRTELIVDGHLLAVRPGDQVRVFAQMRKPGRPLNPGQFDYAAEARSDRQLAMLRCESPDCVTLIEKTSGFSVARLVCEVRLALERHLWQSLGPDRAPVAAAMLAGARQGIARDRAETYRRTGTLHVLVVSGLHVGLVVGVFYFAARLGLFPRRATLVLVMVAIAAYAVLTGARPPVVRAAVLAEIICFAAMFGRQVLAINSLAAAALVVLAWNPSELFRSGPQLSFIAAATLMCLGRWELGRGNSDPMERLLASVKPWYRRAADATIRSAAMILLATLVVWCVTAPLLMTRFHLLSPVAVPISLAVFPLVATIVVSGLALVTIGAVVPFADGPLAFACGRSIDLLETIVNAANETDGGTVWLGGPPAWWTVGAYVLFAGGLLLPAPRWRVRLATLGLAWITIGFGAATIRDDGHGELRCSFIAVGHGCSVLVQTPEGGTIVYDAGSLGSPQAAAETIAGVLWERGVSKIDALVLSHADVDHFNAAPGLLERFNVGGVYVSPMMFEAARSDRFAFSAPAAMLREIEAHGVPVIEVNQGARMSVGGAAIDILHPTAADAGREDNANSLVLAIECNGQRVLLPGDLEAPGIEDVMFQAPYDCDVLLAPHHGSARSDPPGFAAWSTPEWVVVSGGDRGSSTQAGATYAEAGAAVLWTSEVGMVEFRLGDRGASVKTHTGPGFP